MTRRQQAYFLFRGGSAGIFLLSATALPRGAPAVIGCAIAGMGGLLTCIGVNAGGPGEQAGARVQHVEYEKVRPPQGDWPPYAEDRIVDSEIVK